MPPASATPVRSGAGPSGHTGRSGRGGRASLAASAAGLGVGLTLVAQGVLGLGDRGPLAVNAFAVAPPVGVAAPRPGASAPAGAGRPLRVDLPDLEVSAPVQQVATVKGVLGVPDDPGRVGWWSGSSPVGAAAGATVLAGHVDSARLGPGAFFRLHELSAGSTVTVSSATTRVTYRVYARQVHDKARPLPAGLFTRTGPPHLVLITCGGPFDERTSRYRDNIVVLAAPVAVAPAARTAA